MIRLSQKLLDARYTEKLVKGQYTTNFSIIIEGFFVDFVVSICDVQIESILKLRELIIKGVCCQGRLTRN